VKGPDQIFSPGMIDRRFTSYTTVHLGHVGVLQVLEEQGIPFHFIVGSSMGAMIGGIYGSGTDIKILGKVFEQIDLGRFFEIGIPTMGFINGTKINEFLKLLTKNKRFEDLFLPVYMVATDLYTGTTVVINEGSVAEAIRASISIPGIFRPVPRGQMLLVDGAVTDRVPVEAAAQMGADIIIAVDVKFGAGKQIVINNTLDVILTSLDIMQRQQLDTICNKSDVLIQPAVAGYNSWDFNKAQELIALGREATLAKLEELKEVKQKFSPQV
jgi:NTE family protein